jgi:ankyrin repeat protein
MLKLAIILLATFTMATYETFSPRPDELTTPDEVMSKIMAAYRSRGFIESTRNGITMLNPYHFYHTGNLAEDQQLAASLLDQIYAAPIGEQASLAEQLGHENDKAGPYMLWEAFVTGHADVYTTLSKTFARGAGPGAWDGAVDNYRASRVEEVFNSSSEIKVDAIRTWLEEFQGEDSHLLFKAAVEGDETVLSHLLDAGIDLHPKWDPSIVPLHAACHNGRLGAAQQLVNAGISVDHPDEFGGTPLMRAASGDSADVVEWLLQDGANPHTRETKAKGHTALELGMSNARVAELLLNSGAEWTPTAFAAAVHHGHQEPFERMKSLSGLASGKSANSQRTALDDRQRDALLLSIKHCASKQPASGETVRWLLGQLGPVQDGDLYMLHGSDKELLQSLRDGIGGAVRIDDADTARLLIQNLASNDAEQTGESQTEELNEWLLRAIFYNSASVVRMLLSDFHLDPNAVVGPRFEAPLTVAAIAGQVDMIKLLVSDFNADIHKANGPLANGPTALWHAINAQNEKAARALLELKGPVEGIHAAVNGGEKRIWLVAKKQSSYRSPVDIVAWMSPSWEDEDSEDRFLCLEYPEGFQGPVMIRKDDVALAEGDERPMGEREESQTRRWLKAMTDIIRRR